MRLSHHFGRTLRQVPAEAETPSHQLLLRAGLVQQLAAGIYSYLPLGGRVLRKIEQIIREEMDAAGGEELMLPALHPIEIWEAYWDEAKAIMEDTGLVDLLVDDRLASEAAGDHAQR